ncbi:MAG: hypothetical protein OXE96_08490 [Gemmatimonadetes bacterium]|nr:hypothetical protein [Gemmatimonadota bacterium]
MIAVYADSPGVRHLIESLLSGTAYQTAGRQSEFRSMMEQAHVGIVGTLECSTGAVRDLMSTVRFGEAVGPTCIVVTPVTFENLRTLREIECDRLHVVWVEEVEERLPRVLEAVAPSGFDPLHPLGTRLLSALSLSTPVARAVKLACGVSHNRLLEVPRDRPGPPASSVSELAKRVNLDPKELGYRWTAEIPLRCTLKQMLKWAVLLWAIRQRNGDTWQRIADNAGLSPQTLRRYSLELLQCGLDSAACSPTLVKRRFDEWLSWVTIE